MDSPDDSNRRDGKRFDIRCPATVVIRGKGKSVVQERARLLDIGARGASLYAQTPLEVGSDVTLMIEFPDGTGGVKVVEFDGLVTRAQAQPLYEAAVVFRRRGRFLRTSIADLLARLRSGSESVANAAEAPEASAGLGGTDLRGSGSRG